MTSSSKGGGRGASAARTRKTGKPRKPGNKKTFVFSFDGTGNEPIDAGKFTQDESISNVLKLHLLMGGGVEVDKSATQAPDGSAQITRYYNGIGTREGRLAIPLLGHLRRTINQALAPTFGDARRILNEAHADFAEQDYRHQRGDRIVIFGFSRGAALARRFASELLGRHADCEIAFLGVFDTVAAMNGIHRQGERLSSDVVFENGTLHEGIKQAVHLLALDEDRVAFSPTLINQDPNNPKRIEEVWLPGVHSDIGGGYWFDGLSDLALAFMIARCQATLGQAIAIADARPTGPAHQNWPGRFALPRPVAPT